MAIGLFPLLGRRGGELLRRRLCMTMTTTPSLSQKRTTFRRRACRSTARIARLGSVGRRSTRNPSPASWRWTTTASVPTTTRAAEGPTTPSLSLKKRRAFQKNALSDHDHRCLLGREGVVVIVMRICLLRISSSRLGKGKTGGHGHTHSSSWNTIFPSGERKGWWP